MKQKRDELLREADKRIVSWRMGCSLQVASNDFMRRIRELGAGGRGSNWSLFTDKESLGGAGGRRELPEIAELLETMGEMDLPLL